MVTRSRFVAKHDGAPPTPPPGGYQRARQFPSSPFAPELTMPFAPREPEPKPARRRHWFGWAALGAAAGLALVLLIQLAMGATDTIYGTTMIALQLVVAAVVIAALFVPNARFLGAIALTVAVILNVGTIGAASALQSSAAGTYDGETVRDKTEQEYPGIRDVDPDLVLQAESLEQMQARFDSLSEAIRTELTDRFGFTWVRIGEGSTRPERNGYGGESMLVEYSAPVWATEQPIRTEAQKREVMAAIDDGLLREGVYWPLYPLNADSGITDDSLDKLYGSADPATQVVWEWYTEVGGTDLMYESGAPDPSLFYATITDLTHDDTGVFRQRQEAENASDGTPLEGLQLFFLGRQLLSEADREAFEQAIADSPID
ncbi:hypothetical protein [Microbacterium sediminis]|uniref:Uncharacterized protein n=1 Tax=Microbacterium sediminis TaxID=904291 RepID=A0A1B9NIT6_9MICO|nr:hypothetical protein [Microbacterium sediminis]OCG76484.1 hypothetical protein A7J15_11930 [Microbacterium sediminis]